MSKVNFIPSSDSLVGEASAYYDATNEVVNVDIAAIKRAAVRKFAKNFMDMANVTNWNQLVEGKNINYVITSQIIIRMNKLLVECEEKE
jgi:hypothetical protein